MRISSIAAARRRSKQLRRKSKLKPRRRRPERPKSARTHLGGVSSHLVRAAAAAWSRGGGGGKGRREGRTATAWSSAWPRGEAVHGCASYEFFRADRTHTLVIRLGQNVVKTGLRKISVSYSRITFADIGTKLHLKAADAVKRKREEERRARQAAREMR